MFLYFHEKGRVLIVSSVCPLNCLIMCVIVMLQRWFDMFFFFNDVSPKSVFKILVRIFILSGFFFFLSQEITAIARFSITVLAVKKTKR